MSCFRISNKIIPSFHHFHPKFLPFVIQVSIRFYKVFPTGTSSFAKNLLSSIRNLRNLKAKANTRLKNQNLLLGN